MTLLDEDDQKQAFVTVYTKLTEQAKLNLH